MRLLDRHPTAIYSRLPLGFSRVPLDLTPHILSVHPLLVSACSQPVQPLCNRFILTGSSPVHHTSSLFVRCLSTADPPLHLSQISPILSAHSLLLDSLSTLGCVFLYAFRLHPKNTRENNLAVYRGDSVGLRLAFFKK